MTTRTRRSSFGTLLLTCLLVMGLVGPWGTVAAVELGGTGVMGDESGERLQQTSPQPPLNNSKVIRHQRPNSDVENTDLDQISLFLARQMKSRINSSSVSLREGQYAEARKAVGPEYREILNRYVEVSERTSSEEDDQVASRLNRVSERQQDLSEKLETFNETLQSYREAKRSGNSTRANQLAHDLTLLSEDISQEGKEVMKDKRYISNNSRLNLQGEIELTNRTVTETKTAANDVIQQQFDETNLTVQTEVNTGSFVDPIRLRGRLTSKGTPLADQEVRFVVGTQQLRTRTDETGRFSVRYRPVNRSVGRQSLTVTYQPERESNLRSASATVGVVIERTDPTIAISASPGSVTFRDVLNVSGQVSAGGVGAGPVGLAIFVGGQRVNDTETTDNGQFAANVRVPKAAQPGEEVVRVALVATNRSFAPTSGTTNVTVVPKPTRLRVSLRNATRSDTVTTRPATNAKLEVTGQLETVDGTPLSNEQVELQASGRALTTVSTDENGRFSTVITVPKPLLPTTVGGEQRILIEAIYEGERTSLGASRGQTLVIFQSVLTAVIADRISLFRSLIAVSAIGAVVLSRRQFDSPEQDTRAEPSGSDRAGTTSRTESEGSKRPGEYLLDIAEQCVQKGQYDRAVQFAYAGARCIAEQSRNLPVEHSETHWEFFRYYQSEVAASAEEPLRRLTELYERAAFDTTRIRTNEAEQAIETARSFGER